MVHANARLTQHGRVLLVRRVRVHGRPVAHVAKELGISRQCADGLTVSAMLRQAKQGSARRRTVGTAPALSLGAAAR